ncbi:MAG TPA: hypothetical protein VGP54_10065 [Gaiellaceae bacterium]|nr:hypothetical protein [Gaiellaceae bacterium]
MRKLIMLFAVSLAALVGASAAGANNFPIFKCPYTSTAGGHNSFAGSPIFIGGANNSQQQPLILHFGWLANKQQQVQQFLNVQSMPNDARITQTDSLGNPVATVWDFPSWLQSGGIWDPIVPATGTFNGATFNGFSTVWKNTDADPSNPIPTLSPGTYSLSFGIYIAQGVNDGNGGAGKGFVYQTLNCPFTVQS